MKWKNANKKLPKGAGQAVLVTARNSFKQKDIFIAYMGYGDYKWYTTDVCKMQKETETDNRVSENWKITHWRYLPKPPKSVKV